MTLGEAVDQLEQLDPDATIYASRPWVPSARAAVAVEPEDGTHPADAAGLEYFLEVDIAMDAVRAGSASTRFERVLYYAEHDAFLFDE